MDELCQIFGIKSEKYEEHILCTPKIFFLTHPFVVYSSIDLNIHYLEI
jgi:hypothetical protein